MSTEIVVDDITWTRVWSDGMCDDDGNFYGMTIQRVDEGPCKGRLAIHDMSGDNPNECDDGVMWIDEQACLKVYLSTYPNRNTTYDNTPRVKFLCREGDPDTGNLHEVSASARSLWLLVDCLETYYKKSIAVDIDDDALCFFGDWGRTAIALNRTKRPAVYNAIINPAYIERKIK
jgi:hypothetical protein